MTADRHARIGIVGASCAGLSAAESLRDLGYTDITLLEAKSRPGGKTFSIVAGGEGRRDVIIEGGTVWYIPGERYAELLRRAGLDDVLLDTPPVQLVDIQSGKVSSPFLIDTDQPVLSRMGQTLRFIRELRRHGREDAPGFRDPEVRSLGVTSKDWFAQNGLPFAREAFAPVAISAQMGHIEPEISAAYVLKLLAVLNRYPLHRQLSLSLTKLAPGNQELWTRLAARHKVLYRTDIKRVERGAGVRVETAARVHRFDRLIWAAPPDAFLQVADASEEEQDVFSRVRTLQRAVITCRIEGVRPGIFYFVKNTVDNRVPVGYPTVMYEVEHGSGIHNFYPYMAESTTLDEMMGHIRDLVRRVGGTSVELVRDPLYWTWFPHFSAEDVQAGIYERAEALQGKARTFFSNELYAGVSVVYGLEYAHDLVRRFFA